MTDEEHIEAHLSDIMVCLQKLSVELTRPSVVFKAVLTEEPDNTKANAWRASTTNSSMSAWGSTPDEAMRNFDVEWLKP